MGKIFCHHCASVNVKKESNAIIYGKPYGNGKCYYCHDCHAYVGTHDNGRPLGQLTTKNTHVLRKACHDIFDRTWKYEKKASRSFLYKTLANYMQLKQKECHFGEFQAAECIEALSIISVDEWWRK